jgi:putative FmdB family regulatory protein
MPTYEYRCPDGHEFEIFYRKISDAGADVLCPQCGKVAVRKMSAGAGLLFKGSGFYLTDYGKNAHRGGKPEVMSQADGSGGDSGGSGSESKSSESKSESKADAKGESKSGESKGSESKSAESKPASATSGDAKPAKGAAAPSSSTTPKSDK